VENTDLDRILGLSGQCRRKAKGKNSRGGKPAAAPWSLSDHANGFEHRDFLCLTRAIGRAPSRDGANRKECANQSATLIHWFQGKIEVSRQKCDAPCAQFESDSPPKIAYYLGGILGNRTKIVFKYWAG
jgi:hypothetical protein